MNEVYYRIFLAKNNKDILLICMQNFDEVDYDQNRFLSSKEFSTEEHAIEFIMSKDISILKDGIIKQALFKFQNEHELYNTRYILDSL